ncbi:hypothetical protein [Roseobacter litoralis]|uniref:hypothetical protein n=1 Tax=Roseobacter litoralis TaxID=42443 RepID=UPI0024943173|nr:hypothetical protein [Roseobacter litoralis]
MLSDTPKVKSATPEPLSTIFIGGLITHRRLDATAMLNLAAQIGLAHDAAARAVLDLIGRGYASVMRDDDGLGEMLPTPKIDEISCKYRVRCVVAHLVAVKGQVVRHA